MVTSIPTIERLQVAASFPKRPHDSHKGMFGLVAVIGGATGMVGAALLTARAALKLGAGGVHAGMLAENAPAIDPAQPELMLHDAACTLGIPGINVFAIGCGMGRSVAAQKLLHDVMGTDAALVLDADALNILSQRPDLRPLLLARKRETVITPHPGEAARLLGREIKDVQGNRVASVQELAQRFACSVVLKGADSLCATRDGRLFVNNTGNPGMSAAGMGDVLTGIVASFIAQGMTADDALLLAVHLHGAAGDELAKQQATIGMTATEVTEWARWLLNQWTSSYTQTQETLSSNKSTKVTKSQVPQQDDHRS